MNNMTSHEREVLEMLGGRRPWESGAWVNACFEFLAEMGYCTRRAPYTITEKGKRALLEPPSA